MAFFRRHNPHSPPVVTQMGSAAQVVRDRARAARREVIVLSVLLAGVFVLYHYRRHLFHADVPVRVGCALALIALGWRFARDVGRAASPALFKRVEPATAGTVGFLIRFALLMVALLVALETAGVKPRTLAVGGAFTAVILGIAAQNTLGNLFAGVLLLSARPFRVGDRVRFQAGGIAGQLEGVVRALGLLYVTLVRGEDTILIPNTVVMSAAVVPLREPASVDLRARLKPDVKPSELQSYLERAVTTATRTHPHIRLEEVDGDEVVMRIEATPEVDRDGPKLADEILAAVGAVTGCNGNGNGRGPVAGDDGAPRAPDGRAGSGDDAPSAEHGKPARSADAAGEALEHGPDAVGPVGPEHGAATR